MQISYRYNLISINTNTDLLNFSLENLYKSQSKIEEKSLFRAGNIFNLKIVRENSLEDHLSSGCYGLILETACSYKTNNSKDYTFEFKITDPSIYPQIARIVVFHKCLQEIPKVARFGDIVIFDKILFKTEDGVLNGRSATGSKFSLFSIEKNHINPYSVFNGNLKPSPNHKEILTYLRD